MLQRAVSEWDAGRAQGRGQLRGSVRRRVDPFVVEVRRPCRRRSGVLADFGFAFGDCIARA